MIVWTLIGVVLFVFTLFSLHVLGYLVIEDRRASALGKDKRLVLLIFNCEIAFVSSFSNGMREIVFCLPFKIYLNFTTYMTGPEVLEDGTKIYNKFGFGWDVLKRGVYLHSFSVFDFRFGWDRFYSVDLTWKKDNDLMYPEWCVRRIKI